MFQVAEHFISRDDDEGAEERKKKRKKKKKQTAQKNKPDTNRAGLSLTLTYRQRETSHAPKKAHFDFRVTFLSISL